MNIELKDLSHNPVYAQVREQIQNQIGNKTLASGESLPSPAALAQKLSVEEDVANDVLSDHLLRDDVGKLDIALRGNMRANAPAATPSPIPRP